MAVTRLFLFSFFFFSLNGSNDVKTSPQTENIRREEERVSASDLGPSENQSSFVRYVLTLEFSAYRNIFTCRCAKGSSGVAKFKGHFVRIF